jgi:hypothetical protein
VHHLLLAATKVQIKSEIKCSFKKKHLIMCETKPFLTGWQVKDTAAMLAVTLGMA